MARLAKTHDTAIVSYSTGKDSMIVMDLCAKHFKKVIALHMYLVRDIAYIERGLNYARRRWGCEVIQYPHWALFKYMKDNQFCNYPEAKFLTEVSLSDVYALALRDTGCKLILTGAKKADGLWRRRWLRTLETSLVYANVKFPIQEWMKLDVTAYMKTNAIPMPALSASAKSGVSGIGLNSESILWMNDTQPDDYDRMTRVFPFIGAVVARREFYGIGKRFSNG